MEIFDVPGLDEFLRDYPLMGIRPATGKGFLLKGEFSFRARNEVHGEVTDSFDLTISVPEGFPKIAPMVTEDGRRIPRKPEFHVNVDGTLCLGSPIRVLLQLSKKATLPGFAELCLIPYLFAISLKLRNGGGLVFSELAHGTPGILSDYADLFGLREPEQIRQTLRLLGMKKRMANKRPCPCGCGKRLGKCRFNLKITEARRLSHRAWFKQHASINL